MTEEQYTTEEYEGLRKIALALKEWWMIEASRGWPWDKVFADLALMVEEDMDEF